MVGRYVNCSIWIDQAKANMNAAAPPKSAMYISFKNIYKMGKGRL